MNKYSFNSLIGNNYTRVLLERMLSNNNFSPFTIFEGVFGTGKSTSAHIAAMRLTCDNPKGGEPCGVCQSCRANIRAFETTGESYCVKVANLGKFVNKTEVNDLIKDVFNLQSGSKSRVYIFEEAHELKNMKGAQTALLEEFDRMPPNTYIIMCTTRGYDIIPELASRAVQFKFNKLSTQESYALAAREANGALTPRILNLVVKYSNGVPRNIINSVHFITSNDVSEEEYQEFVCEVSDDILLTIFASMTESNMMTFITLCNDLLEKRSPSIVYNALKDLMVRILFCKEGVDIEMSAFNKEIIDSIFHQKSVNQIFGVLDKYNDRLSEADMKFAFYKIRLIIQNRSIRDVFTDSSKVASIVHENVKTERIKSEQTAQPGRVLQPIDLSKLSQF